MRFQQLPLARLAMRCTEQLTSSQAAQAPAEPPAKLRNRLLDFTLNVTPNTCTPCRGVQHGHTMTYMQNAGFVHMFLASNASAALLENTSHSMRQSDAATRS
jgi:hypothetical protein